MDGNDWKQVDGHLEPLWFEGDFLPQVDVDTITDDNQGLSDSDDNPEEYFMDDEYDESDSGDELCYWFVAYSMMALIAILTYFSCFYIICVPWQFAW